MHVPDGFIDAPTSAVTGVVAAGALAVSLRGARRELDERTAPLAGLVAAFIFAVQMLNFPVAAGTSGHLLGGALAAILVGPYTAVLCVSVVLLMQGVLFADGGLTALGVNITDMAIVTTVVSYAVFRGLLAVLPRKRRSVTVASFVAALVSVPAAAVAFTLIYAVGGTTDVSIGKVATAMIGVHVLIGVGEAVITALTVGAVIAVRPDLVYGARGLRQRLRLRVNGTLVDAPAPTAPVAARTSRRTLWVTGLVTSCRPARRGPAGLREDAHLRQPPRPVRRGDRPHRRATGQLPAGVHPPVPHQCRVQPGPCPRLRPPARPGRATCVTAVSQRVRAPQPPPPPPGRTMRRPRPAGRWITDHPRG
ncbi:energy-coupling factor ABC transporter permease [Streptomyces olivaceoviridis]